MNEEIDVSNDNITLDEDKKFQLEFENEKDQKTYRKRLFYGMGILVIIMFVISFTATYCFIFHIKLPFFDICCTTSPISKQESIGATVLISLTLMIPTVLSLAMMRFLFGNNTEKEEKNIPSIIFNIGKELKETLIAYIDKK